MPLQNERFSSNVIFAKSSDSSGPILRQNSSLRKHVNSLNINNSSSISNKNLTTHSNDSIPALRSREGSHNNTNSVIPGHSLDAAFVKSSKDTGTSSKDTASTNRMHNTAYLLGDSDNIYKLPDKNTVWLLKPEDLDKPRSVSQTSPNSKNSQNDCNVWYPPIIKQLTDPFSDRTDDDLSTNASMYLIDKKYDSNLKKRRKKGLFAGMFSKDASFGSLSKDLKAFQDAFWVFAVLMLFVIGGFAVKECIRQQKENSVDQSYSSMFDHFSQPLTNGFAVFLNDEKNSASNSIRILKAVEDDDDNSKKTVTTTTVLKGGSEKTTDDRIKEIIVNKKVTGDKEKTDIQKKILDASQEIEDSNANIASYKCKICACVIVGATCVTALGLSLWLCGCEENKNSCGCCSPGGSCYCEK